MGVWESRAKPSIYPPRDGDRHTCSIQLSREGTSYTSFLQELDLAHAHCTGNVLLATPESRQPPVITRRPISDPRTPAGLSLARGALDLSA